MIIPATLEGPSVRLAPLGWEHLDRLCKIGLDPVLWQNTTIKVSTAAEMKSYVGAALESQKSGTALPFVIVKRGAEEIVGCTRFHSAVPEHKRVEIGFTWIAPPWQRTIINTETKYLMLRHAFEAMGCVRVEFKTNAGNHHSRRALLRIGAKEEGVLRNYRVAKSGALFDLVLFSIIAQEWPAICRQLEAKLGNTP